MATRLSDTQQRKQVPPPTPEGGLGLVPQAVTAPAWISALPDGGTRWQVRDLDTGGIVSSTIEAPPHQDIDAIDDGQGHRYEIIQLRERVSGQGYVRLGAPKLYQPKKAIHAAAPLPPPGASPEHMLSWQVAQGLSEIKSALARGGSNGGTPQNPYLANGFEPVVPKTTLDTVQSSADMRIKAANDAAEERIQSVRRQLQGELDSVKAAHTTTATTLQARVTDLERQMRDRDEEISRLRRNGIDDEAEGERLGRELRQANTINSDLQRQIDTERHDHEEVVRLRRKLEVAEDEREGIERDLRKANKSIAELEDELEGQRERNTGLGRVPGRWMGRPTGDEEIDDSGDIIRRKPRKSELDTLIENQEKLKKVADMLGYERPGQKAAVDPTEPEDVRRMKGISDIISTSAKSVVEVLNEYRTGSPAKPTTNGQQQPQAGNVEGRKFLVMLLEGHFKANRQAQEAYTALAPFVPADAKAALAALPQSQFVADIYQMAAADTPLRSLQGRMWLEHVHSLIGGRALPPPDMPTTPRPLVQPPIAQAVVQSLFQAPPIQTISAPAAMTTPPPAHVVQPIQPSPFGGRRFSEILAERQREATEANAEAHGGGVQPSA